MVRDGIATRVTVKFPESLLRYIAVKGSVTIDGVSLTVTDVDSHSFSVSLIPQTKAVTTLGDAKVGKVVNVEVDLLARYTERLLSAGRKQETKKSGLSLEWLAENGF